ncbi:hypothetical protein [Sphingomonas aquatilis]
MSSLPPMPLTGGRAIQKGASGSVGRRPAILLGANLYEPLAWWMDPVRAIVFVVLPIFCFAAYFNRFNYWTFNASRDFITPQTFGLGLYSMAMLVVGITVGRLLVPRQDMVSLIDGERATRVLIRIGWVAILAYAILLGTLVMHLSLVLSLLRGDIVASGELRNVLGRIPGITSFVQFGTVYLALVSTLVMMTNYSMTPRLWTMTAVIFALVFARSILASERLALLEALAALGVIPIAYRWRPSLWRTIAPFIGIIFVFVAFAALEYFRSWQYYQQYYDTYADFIAPRFAGYFSTSINNGAGAYLTYGQFTPKPEITVGWITKFPILGSFIREPDVTMMDNFLEMYATPEFNNPGGFYAAFLDYPFPIATAFMIGLGAVIGTVHRSFQNKSLIGMLLYPAVFLGTTDLIRIVYISDTRTLPLFLGAIITAYAIKPVRMPRDRFLTYAAGAARQTATP